MNALADIPAWISLLTDANPASGGEVWTGFEGLNPGWALLIFSVAAVLIVRTYFKGPGSLGAGKRLLLAILRILAVGVLLFILMEPVVRVTEESTARGMVLVLDDASESMDIRDARPDEQDQERVKIAFGDQVPEQDPSRRELVEAVAANPALNLWPSISEKADIIVAPFGRSTDEVLPLTSGSEATLTTEQAAAFFRQLPSGKPATAVTDSLGDALGLTVGRPLTSVVLISDGRNNAGTPLPAAAEILRQRGLPVFVYAPGVEAQQDLSIESFTGPTLAYAREEAVLNVRLNAVGLQGKRTQVILKNGDEEIERQDVTLGADGATEVTFNYVPKEAGELSLTAEALPLPGEATEVNNTATLALRVLDRRVKVLLIEQEPRWDFRYLLDTLKRDRRVEVDAVMLDGDATLGTHEDSRFLAKLPTPEELLQYVIVVLGDVDPGRLSPAHMEALDKLARQTGGGLVFHAGPQYDPFSYGHTILADLLPVQVIPVADPAQRYPEPVSLVLTPQGRRSPLLRLVPSSTESEAIWRSFPGVRWTARTGPAKPAAEVLLVDPNPSKRTDGRPQPVLVQMPVGRGQVFYFGFDETWRWRSRVGEKYYLKIWGQVFLRLGLERLSGASDLVQLNTVRSTYTLGEDVLVAGRIFDADFQPLEKPQVKGTLTIEPEGQPGAEPIERPLTLTSQPGRPGTFEVQIPALVPGRYSVRTEEDPDAAVTFTVNVANLELRDPTINLSGLAQLTRDSGKLMREEDLAQLPGLIGETLPRTREVRSYEPAFNPFIYALLLLLPAAEWVIRRLHNLK
ncbi:MAG: hypothetical protein Q7Q73_09530 [Verrucomicrobiota bacterium JB024]|nr:hypothetical protein [Verrucomicrobiota bacterium JB024]